MHRAGGLDVDEHFGAWEKLVEDRQKRLFAVFALEKVVHEGAIADVGRDPPGRGVGGAEIPLAFEDRVDVCAATAGDIGGVRTYFFFFFLSCLFFFFSFFLSLFLFLSLFIALALSQPR